MNAIDEEELIEQEFHVSWYIITYKLLFGIFEVVLATLLALYGRAAAVWYHDFALREITEDPHDLLIYMTTKVLPNVLNHRTFLIIYLLTLGSAKIAGSIGLMYQKNWGVDLLVGVTLLMFPFQLVQFLLHPTFMDFAYIFIGLSIAMYLINFKPHVWAKKMAQKGKRHTRFLRTSHDED